MDGPKQQRSLAQEKEIRERWLAAEVPTAVQLQLDQPFGKNNLTQCFTSDVCFRHALVFVMQSGHLDAIATNALLAASPHARLLDKLIRDHTTIDFRPLRNANPNWESETTIPAERVRMVTACLIYYNFDVAAMVRYIGGTHVGAHRDTDGIINELRGKIPTDVLRDLERLYRHGAPRHCNAHSSEANYQAFRAYGNHASVANHPDVAMKAFVKDSKKQFLLAAKASAFSFCPHSHQTPVAIANAGHPYKKARFVFDSSFRPEPWCYAINDWTDKANEPPLHFASSYYDFLVWIWNLRISYPNEDIYPGDDDVAGAFRHGKYHPSLVAMHGVIIFGLTILMTGMTFGDNTSPSNWEPVARARSHYAQHIWSDPDLLERAEPYIPPFTVADPPTPEEQATFQQATADSINRGVFNPDGTRRPPPFRHHVDDNLYADIRKFLLRTLAAAVLSLYVVLGFPSQTQQNPLSFEKLDSHYNHKRAPLNRDLNTRTLTVSMTATKRQILINELGIWGTKRTFTILEAATLYGLLSDAAQVCRWAWPCFFALRNALNYALREQYHKARGYATRARKRQRLRAQLPKSLHNRLQSLVAKDIASYIWRNRVAIPMNQLIKNELAYLFAYLSIPTNPWEISIGHIIKRDPHGTTAGDASHVGVGAINDEMQFFIDGRYSTHLRARIKETDRHHDGRVHINAMEFVIIILQVAAIITAVEDAAPGAYPPLMVYRILTDNTAAKSWLSRMGTGSIHGQRLLRVLAELLRRSDIGCNCDHIAGADNILPDFISRLSPSLTPLQRREQIFAKDPRTRSWRSFLPSPTLLSLLRSSLSSSANTVLPALPDSLGRFVNASSTSSCSFVI